MLRFCKCFAMGRELIIPLPTTEKCGWVLTCVSSYLNASCDLDVPDRTPNRNVVPIGRI